MLADQPVDTITDRRGIVVGCPRSGTTFLSRILNAVPGAESLIGTLYPTPLCQLANHVDAKTKRVLAIALERSLDEYLHSGRCWSRAMSLQKWANAPTGMGGLLRALKGKRDIDILVYKEPFLSFAPDLVLDAFPSARVINIVRDGRDVANSLVHSYTSYTEERLRDSPINIYGVLGRKVGDLTVPWWVEEGKDDLFLASTPFVRAIWMWKYVVRRCREYFDRPEVVSTGNVITVHYERLMQNPEEEGIRILNHLGLSPGKSFWKQLATAHDGSFGNYKRRPAEEIAAAEAVAGDVLRMEGYL